jgi:PhoH-like ATPase
MTQRTLVLDTSVLLADPRAFERFNGWDVIVPITVVSELEGKRHHPELGYFARVALRTLDDMREQHGDLSQKMPTTHGGSVRIELAAQDVRGSTNDDRILAVAASLQAAEAPGVTVVSKDLPMRVKAAAAGLAAEDYVPDAAPEEGWTGTTDLAVVDDVVQALYDTGEVRHDTAQDLPVHTGLTVRCSRGSALARITPEKTLKVVRGDREVFGLRGRSAEQRLALELLMDPDIGIVSLGGRAGTGKSALALAAGLESVLEKRQHKKVIVFRPLYAVGGQQLGYLPGDEGEKMGPWAQAVYDCLGTMANSTLVREITARQQLEVLPLTHIRGRSLHDAFVIVDEAQSLERNVLLTVLSRIGTNSKIVLTHDVAQRDNLRVGRHDGVASVIEKLKGHPLFAHITLTRSERSAVAALVTSIFEGEDMTAA